MQNNHTEADFQAVSIIRNMQAQAKIAYHIKEFTYTKAVL